VENTFDLPTVMKLSVGLSVTGSFLRLLPILLSTLYDDISYRQTTFAFCCYHICAILNAASGPLIMGSVSLLSATWFSEEERTTATAVAQTSNGLGTTIGFLNPILFDIKDSTIPSVSRVSYIFYTTAIISVAPLLCIPYIPSKPDHPPSRSQSEKANEVGTETASLKLSSTSFVVLILVCAILSGVSDGWQGCFQRFSSFNFLLSAMTFVSSFSSSSDLLFARWSSSAMLRLIGFPSLRASVEDELVSRRWIRSSSS